MHPLASIINYLIALAALIFILLKLYRKRIENPGLRLYGIPIHMVMYIGFVGIGIFAALLVGVLFWE